VIEITHLAQIRLLHRGIGNGEFFADDLGELRQQIG
jgi:hypothetical protein